MSKKYYLLPQENVGDLDRQRTGFNSGFDEDIAKEVEVLDDKEVEELDTAFANSDTVYLSNYLKANNYLIVKIV